MAEFFYFAPDAKNNMTENIVYNTDIIESFNGSEQRIPLLQNPRNYFSYYYTLTGNELKVFNNFIFRNQSEEIDFPIWQEVSFLNNNANSGTNTLLFNFEYQRFQDNMNVALIKRNDPKNYKIYIISSVDLQNGMITLGSNLAEDWEIGDLLLPVVTGRIEDSIQKVFPQGSDDIAGFDVKFRRIITNQDIIIDSDIIYPTFRDLLVLDKQPNKTSTYNQQMQRKILELDLGYGKTATYDKSDQFFNLFNYNWTLTNKKQINDLKTFANSIKGRLENFWMPTFENDMVSVNTSYLSTEDFIDIEHQDFFNTFEDRDINIVVNLKNGNKKFFEVIDMFDNGTFETLTFSETWGEDIDSNDIDSINLLWRCRFNNDEFLFVYINKNMAQVGKNAFMQKFNDYIPPAP